MNEEATALATSDIPPTGKPWLAPALGGVIVVSVLSAGTPLMNAPWLLGDEHVFIVNNSDVTGQGRTERFSQRLLGIFANVHEDLYQPIPILTYAIEWRISAGDPLVTRRTDVILHAINALLVWAALYALLARLGGMRGQSLLVMTWALALFWALHPIQITSYVADMCRKHLLSAMFALTAFLLHLRALRPAPRSWLWFSASLLSLAAAMLCKPVVGWFLLTIALEWTVVGTRISMRTPAFYIRTVAVAVPCVFFAGLTLLTSVQSGMMGDTSLAVFGDPLTRSLFSFWLYAGNLIEPFRLNGWYQLVTGGLTDGGRMPLRLSTWYLSDPTTGWASPAVWFSLVFAAGSLLIFWRTMRSAALRGIALGIAWWWALLLPVSGIVAARIAAANDRYMYQPLIGIVLVVGIGFVRWMSAGPSGTARRRPAWLVALVLASIPYMFLIDRIYCQKARTTILRAQRVVDLYPGDPRALEYLAQAYDLATTRETYEAADHPPEYFLTSALDSYTRAARTADHAPRFFPSAHDRAAFRRRISFRLLQLGIGAPDELAQRARRDSLEQARIAVELEPAAPMSWVRLAQAHRSLGEWDEALAAYQTLEDIIEPDAPNYALIHTEFGTLLSTRLQRHDLARRKFEIARRADPNFLPAAMGLARLEIRFGSGQAGFDLIRQVLVRAPQDIDAKLLAGEYHLRSQHWQDALASYLAILDLDPLQYAALRGFHGACANLGRWSDAVRGWDFAARNSPPDSDHELIYRSFEVWASACAGQPRALRGAESLMRVDPNNRFACLTRMLFALREGRVDDAIGWARNANQGRPLPSANELQRAIATLRLLRRDEGMLSESLIAEAVLLEQRGRADAGRRLLKEFVDRHPSSEWVALAAKLLVDSPRPADRP